MASNAAKSARLYRAKGQRCEAEARECAEKAAGYWPGSTERLKLEAVAAAHRARAARHFERADHFTTVKNRATKRRRTEVADPDADE